MFLSKVPTFHVTKKCEIIFVALCFYLHQFKKYVSDFLYSVSQTGNNNIFVLRSVIYVQHFQIKSCFSGEKTLAVQSGTHFCRKAVKV